ncbi:hypothetical protein DPMN_174604 [Dreissena polymorpha]|uniref:Uncharacterized protein n=1 Tax=Dreissena polymorpha TaxID=45954 RepID=A0A9D4E6L4_DREPO|nr:hypothetical protein DPMN_174604 [Dreissena polymorpha]
MIVSFVGRLTIYDQIAKWRVGQWGHSRLVNVGPQTIRKEGGRVSSSRRGDSKIGNEENVDRYGKGGNTSSLKTFDRGGGRNISLGQTASGSRGSRFVGRK